MNTDIFIEYFGQIIHILALGLLHGQLNSNHRWGSIMFTEYNLFNKCFALRYSYFSVSSWMEYKTQFFFRCKLAELLWLLCSSAGLETQWLAPPGPLTPTNCRSWSLWLPIHALVCVLIRMLQRVCTIICINPHVCKNGRWGTLSKPHAMRYS